MFASIILVSDEYHLSIVKDISINACAILRIVVKSRSVTGQYKRWTADYGLRTTDYGLGIKQGLGIKRGLSITDWV